MSFLKEVWYAAAWADEVAGGALLARTIADQPLVIYRTASGALSCLVDRCPHRFAPLSRGRLTDRGIRCGYHGLEFDGTGECVTNPHGPIARALKIRSYPVVDRHGMVWVWLSEQDHSRAHIPNLSFVTETPSTAFSKGYMHGAANHLLLVDNILDLSHADYLHPVTLGGGSVSRTRAQVEERPGSIFVAWHSPNEIPLPIWKPLLPAGQERCDMWTEVEWFPSGVMLLHAGATPVGQAPEQGLDTMNAHIMTPESSLTTHYFYCNSRSYLVSDAEYNAGMAADLRHAFECEDKPMIEAQQQRVGEIDLFDQHPALLSVDIASTKARRMFERLLAAEARAS